MAPPNPSPHLASFFLFKIGASIACHLWQYWIGGGWQRITAQEEEEQRGRRRRIRRYPDVKANCFDVEFPKRRSEKNVKRGGRREIGDRISRSLDVCGP